MPLSPGAQLGSHEIAGVLGVGGMGEVYRATDTRLSREVAIKVLPPEYAHDAERVARFEREARAVAALNHPGIAAIYEFNQAEGISFLVLELVEGDTLADRLRRGPVAAPEALTITKQICEALEAAHDKGICHRDLKPANIKITPGGAIKILDFGLAKVLDSGSAKANLANSPTLSLAGTYPGVILGTAGYMSPEQAKGFPADHRSDIFSLGCILYELLTGRQTFEGETASEILAAVLKSEPDFASLPSGLNPRIHDLLRRCLEKNPKNRWHSAADVRVEIDTILARGVFTADSSAAGARPWWRRALPVTGGVLAGAAVVAALVPWIPRGGPARPVTRFTLHLPANQQLALPSRGLVALSPDGEHLVYPTNDALYVRAMSEFEPRLVPGTEALAPVNPVFSPDGRSLAFYTFSDRTLKRIPLTGGAAATICETVPPSGFSWSGEWIAFAQPGKGIFRVSATGGVPELLVAETNGETLASPQLLPDGQSILFSQANGTGTNRWESGRIVIQTLGGEQRQVVLEGATDARYIPSGHLAYARGGTLFAVTFDAAQRTVRGGGVAIVEGIRRANVGGGANAQTAHFSYSDTGTLAYVPGPASLANVRADLAIIDRAGSAKSLKLPPAPYQFPRVSPDGRWIAVATDDGRDLAIWVYEVSGGSSLRRLTFGGRNRYPIWSPDSQWVAFQSDREGDLGIFRQRADGTSVAERLTKAETGTAHIPQAWHPKGTLLLYTIDKSFTFTTWTLNLADRSSAQWGELQANIPIQATFSPDGRWIAYQRNDVGSESDIYVQPFPAGGSKFLIPRDTQNHHPLWSPTGSEIFYIPRQGTSMAISITTEPRVKFGSAVPIERGGRTEGPPAQHRNHDVMPDGRRFVGVVPEGEPQNVQTYATQIRIVLNWFDDLRQRVR